MVDSDGVPPLSMGDCMVIDQNAMEHRGERPGPQLGVLLSHPPGGVLVLRRLRPAAVDGRWLALACILCSPVYIFYTRAVLIESMALMFCAWFLLSFVLMCQRSSWQCAAIASVFGALAALVKVTTFMAWAGGAAVGGIWWSWQQWRTHGWSAWRRTRTHRGRARAGGCDRW